MPPSARERAPAVLRFEPAPPQLAPWVVGHVERDDAHGGGVMRLLPEPRASIQITLGDRYWLRPDGSSEWRLAPKLAVWAPRFHPGHGYARQRIHVYALLLSMDGLRALTGAPAAEWVDQILDLADLHPSLAATLTPLSNEPFEHWCTRIEPALCQALYGANLDPRPWPEILSLLGAGDDATLDTAITRSGLSPRQFRRVFQQRHGATPKAYQRVLRVDRMLRQLHSTPWEGDHLADHPLPFADQPHAIREFRTITGLSPGEYIKRKRSGDLTLRSIPDPSISKPETA